MRICFNSFWQMPFRKSFRITMEITGEKALPLYYQIDYSLQDNVASVAYWYQTEPHTPFPDLPGPDELRLSVQKALGETDYSTLFAGKTGATRLVARP